MAASKGTTKSRTIGQGNYQFNKVGGAPAATAGRWSASLGVVLKG
jgi:hypothetical protein